MVEAIGRPKPAQSSFSEKTFLTLGRGSISDDVVDQDFKFTNARRRSNSSTASHHITDFKTKFEVVEHDPVFEETVHGPISEEGDDLSKTDSSESGSTS